MEICQRQTASFPEAYREEGAMGARRIEDPLLHSPPRQRKSEASLILGQIHFGFRAIYGLMDPHRTNIRI
jgi:hypothetical protein